MDQYTRRIIGFGVHAGNADGIALCRMFNHVISGQKSMPKYLSSDNDPLFLFERWKANLRIFDVAEVKTAPYVPLSHPFIERLIDTIRREYLDRILFWATADLENKLVDFRNYCSFGFSTLPRNRIVPVLISRIRYMKGRSTMTSRGWGAEL
jgi:putative transposase